MWGCVVGLVDPGGRERLLEEERDFEGGALVAERALELHADGATVGGAPERE